MSLFYQHNINENTKLAIWKIEEDESFFLQEISLQKKISHRHKRLQHLTGRYLLRFLFADFPNEEIEIADTLKPFLPNEQYHFSISHSGDFAAAIVSKMQRVGIDVEVLTEKAERLKDKFLNEEELKIKSESKIQNTNYQLSTLLWSAKETVFKWWSFGDVDFKENILLQNVNENGTIDAIFKKENDKVNLKLSYQLFEKLCCTWVAK